MKANRQTTTQTNNATDDLKCGFFFRKIPVNGWSNGTVCQKQYNYNNSVGILLPLLPTARSSVTF